MAAACIKKFSDHLFLESSLVIDKNPLGNSGAFFYQKLLAYRSSSVLLLLKQIIVPQQILSTIIVRSMVSWVDFRVKRLKLSIGIERITRLAPAATVDNASAKSPVSIPSLCPADKFRDKLLIFSLLWRKRRGAFLSLRERQIRYSCIAPPTNVVLHRKPSPRCSSGGATQDYGLRLLLLIHSSCSTVQYYIISQY